MRKYECDRCHRELYPHERFCGHIKGHIVDLCQKCHEEYTKDRDLADKMYERNLNAIAVKYGMKSIESIVKGGKYE